jgi:enamine deaminase RidA (YjgF/YER057c/UK114 family)
VRDAVLLGEGLGRLALVLAAARRARAIARQSVLAGIGLGFEHVLQARVFLTEFERDYAAMNAVYASYFPADRRPARTCIGVTALARGGLVEIDLVAKRP